MHMCKVISIELKRSARFQSKTNERH